MKWGYTLWANPGTFDRNGGFFGTGNYCVMSGQNVDPFGAPFVTEQGWVSVIEMEPNQRYTSTQDGKAIACFQNPSDPKKSFLIGGRMSSTFGNEMRNEGYK